MCVTPESASASEDCVSSVSLFQTSFVACMSSYSWPSCSADIFSMCTDVYMLQSAHGIGKHGHLRTFSNTVGSSFLPFQAVADFGSFGRRSRYTFHWERKPMICTGFDVSLWRRNSARRCDWNVNFWNENERSRSHLLSHSYHPAHAFQEASFGDIAVFVGRDCRDREFSCSSWCA